MSYLFEKRTNFPKPSGQALHGRAFAISKCSCGGIKRCSSCSKANFSNANTMQSDVSRSLIYRARIAPESGSTNYAFDTYNLTETHLSDPDIITRLQGLSTEQLVDYRLRANNAAVAHYISTLIQNRPAVNCTAEEVAKTTKLAKTARIATLPWIQLARRALDRLHSRWINHKTEIIAGSKTLSGNPVCAFDSNFNISQRNADYGVNHIRVARRLRSLESKMRRDVAYSCQSVTDQQCSGPDNSDTIAYVRGGQPPIHFCKEFRDDIDPMNHRGVVTHEFAHLLPGVGDAGGYAAPSPQATTCARNVKFSAATSDLRNTADALTGFVLHIGQQQGIRVRVR